MLVSHKTTWDPVHYDAWYDKRRGSALYRIEEEAVLGALGPLAGAIILDIGCGSGRLTQDLRFRGATAIGVDADFGMAGFTVKKGRGPAVVGRAESLPFANGIFDASLAITVLEFVQEVDLAVAEMARVTRAGGRIVIGTLNPKSAWGIGMLQRRRHPPWNSARFPTPKELQERLRPHGKTVITGVPLGSRPPLSGLLATGPRIDRFFGFQLAVCTKA